MDNPDHPPYTSASVENNERNCLANKQSDPMIRTTCKGICQADEIAVPATLPVAGTEILSHKTTAGRIEGRHHIIHQRIGIGRSRVPATMVASEIHARLLQTDSRSGRSHSEIPAGIPILIIF